MIVISELTISYRGGRDNRLNPAIVGWEIPEKEGRKACSGLLNYGSMMAYRIPRNQQNGRLVNILGCYAASLGGVPGSGFVARTNS